MKASKETVNSGNAYVSFIEVFIELLDELKGTTLYQGKIKQLSRQLHIQLGNELNRIKQMGFYDNGEVELSKQSLSSIAENMVHIIKHSDHKKINSFIVALENFKNDDFIIEGE